MNIVCAVIAHETITFSPTPTRLADFFNGGPLYGDAAYAFVRGGGRAASGMIAAAEAHGAEIRMAVAGAAQPSRAVDADAFETMSGALCDAVRQGCDAVFLEMHGAMVTTHLDDGEGELLARIRTIAPGIPIAVALDLHGNISPRTVENCTTLVGYKTYPHVDIVETGRQESARRPIWAAPASASSPRDRPTPAASAWTR
jgi:microcystin degradation protein MlrC